MKLVSKNKQNREKRYYSRISAFARQVEVILDFIIQNCEVDIYDDVSLTVSNKNLKTLKQRRLYSKLLKDNICESYIDGLDYFKLGLHTIQYDYSLCDIFPDLFYFNPIIEEKLLGIFSDKSITIDDKKFVIVELFQKDIQVDSIIQKTIKKLREKEQLTYINDQDLYSLLSSSLCDCNFFEDEKRWTNFRNTVLNIKK